MPGFLEYTPSKAPLPTPVTVPVEAEEKVKISLNALKKVIPLNNLL